MATTITQRPPALIFVGNLEDIHASTTDSSLDFSMSVNGLLVLEENYTADSYGNVRIRIKNILEDQLSVSIPNTDLYIHASGAKDVQCVLGTEEINFRIVKGGVDREGLNCTEFFETSWLTWQPQSKIVHYRDPEYLSFYATQNFDVIVKAYFKEGDEETVTLAQLVSGNLYSINVTFERIHGLFTDQPIYFDVFVGNSSGGENTWRQRYVLTDQVYEFNDLFLFENSLGGIDTIRFTGQKTLLNKQQFDTALFFDETELEYDVIPDKAYEKNTGFFRSRRQLFWAQDFFSSRQKYLVKNNLLTRIITREPSFSAARYELVAFDFQFVFTRQTEYLDWDADEFMDLLIIIGPDDEQYYLVPRLWTFPILEDPSDALFPVQSGQNAKWQTLSFQTILDYVLANIDIPDAVDRVIDAGVLVINSPTSATLTGASWIKSGVTYTYSGPVALTGTPDPENRFDIIHTLNANSVGYIAGNEAPDPIIPNPPSGQLVLHEILRLTTGENVITPTNPSSPSTQNVEGHHMDYAPIWKQTLSPNTSYDFKISYIGWAHNYTEFGQRPLNGFVLVNFVTPHNDTQIDPDRVKVETIDIAPEGGDFVLVQTSSTEATLFARKKSYHQTLIFDYCPPKNTTVKGSSLINGGAYSALPAGAAYKSRNMRDYVPSTGAVRFDRPRSYGYNGTPVTSNITINTDYANSGNMAKMLNSRSNLPSITVPSGVALHKSGGNHVAGAENEYLFICHKNDLGEVKRISYSITQNQA